MQIDRFVYIEMLIHYKSAKKEQIGMKKYHYLYFCT